MYAAKGFVERLLAAGARVAVVDPLGVWWGLRAGADGAAPGYPVVVFGGRHADVPLGAEMGAARGRLIARQAIASIVDLSELGSSAARRRFMAAFAEALYEANAERLHLVLDEADLWAPGHGLLERVRFPAIRTFDSSRTPRRGERLAVPRTLAPVDLTAIVVALAAEAPDTGDTAQKHRRYTQLKRELEAARETNRGSRTGEPRTRPTAGTDYGAGGRFIATCNCDRRAAGPGNPAAIAAGAAGSGLAARCRCLFRGRRTASGRQESCPPAPSPPAERLALWCARLPAPAPEMLRALAAQGGRFMDAAALAAALGKKPSGGHWNSGIVVLRNNGLIEIEAAAGAAGSRRYRAAALFCE